MRKFVAASALVFAFATSAEARTQHHHYRHYAAHHYRHYAYHHYRQQPQEFGFSNFGSGSGFGSESGFGSGFGSGFRDSSFENSGRRRSRYERSSSGQTSYRSASVGGRPGAWCGSRRGEGAVALGAQSRGHVAEPNGGQRRRAGWWWDSASGSRPISPPSNIARCLRHRSARSSDPCP